MIDYKLVNRIFEAIDVSNKPKFEDEDEAICWMLQETWNAAIDFERYCQSLPNKGLEQS